MNGRDGHVRPTVHAAFRADSEERFDYAGWRPACLPALAAAGCPMPTVRRFARAVIESLDRGKIVGIRAGAHSDHRFTGVWAVVVNGRVFARSWTLRPGGWYRTFLEDPLGTLQIGERQLRIRARLVRGERIRDAVERAYAAKYTTPGAVRYVRGFRTPRRRGATMEFLPR